MSEAEHAPPTRQHPEHHLIIQGKILSSQPLVNLRVLDKETGQAADIEVAISYRFRNLARDQDEEEKSYTLLVCLTDQEAIEKNITLPSMESRHKRMYDLDLDQQPRKRYTLAATTGAGPTSASQTKPNPTRSSQDKATKNK